MRRRLRSVRPGWQPQTITCADVGRNASGRFSDAVMQTLTAKGICGARWAAGRAREGLRASAAGGVMSLAIQQ